MASLPITLIIAFTCMFGFVNTHQRHAKNFHGASQTYLLALNISVLLGSLVGLGLLIFYGYVTAWYWPFALFAIASLGGGLLFGLFDNLVGQLGMSMAAFIGWPACAVFTYLVVNGLTK